jgi:hypothetical protein
MWASLLNFLCAFAKTFNRIVERFVERARTMPYYVEYCSLTDNAKNQSGEVASQQKVYYATHLQ